MADTDEVSAAAAKEARDATDLVTRDADQLKRLLESLGYQSESRSLDAFEKPFAEYQSLDAEILPLAVENSNLKAQRLSFGPAQEAVTAFRSALDGAAKSASANACCVGLLAAQAVGDLLDIQVIQARHIAESDEAAMSGMESRMAALDKAAHTAMETLRHQLPAAAGPQLAAASAALARFEATNTDIVALSRRNTNVRSLALSLGRKRTVTAECEDALRTLDEALATHDFKATR